MDEDWRAIPEFPNYSVSTEGRIQNTETGRFMAQVLNQRGMLNVGLTKNFVQHRRSVPLLVAQAFLPQVDHFDTPINLNGDRLNNRVGNLLWRPKWFAIRYIQQFYNGRRGFNVPIVELQSGEEFETSWIAATKYGLIDREILIATTQRTYVWPTYQMFRVI